MGSNKAILGQKKVFWGQKKVIWGQNGVIKAQMRSFWAKIGNKPTFGPKKFPHTGFFSPPILTPKPECTECTDISKT